VYVPAWSRPRAIRTLTGERLLCGHVNALGAFALALDARRLLTGCGPWNEANRCSYTKYCSSAIMKILDVFWDKVWD
jgi:hypothetical protein